MPQLILHHYPQSPVSEKVRIALGMKDLSWHSVEIPRLPPKPDLMPLTGGYRMTPVLQVGADVYCDSSCILRALERLCPDPPLVPAGSAALAWGIGRWTDGAFFKSAIALVFGDGADSLPEAFAADRGALYFGPDFNLADLKTRLPQTLAGLRAQFGWLEEGLGDARDFLLGPRPTLPDAFGYYLVWFVRGRYSQGPAFIGQFPRLCAWEERVAAIGHGSIQDMSAEQALTVALAAEPATAGAVDAGDPQGLAAGEAVEVLPEAGGPAVAGEILALDAQEVVLRRQDGRVGTVAVHFPRVGYAVRRA